jgi:FAD/FMN-containing dehydrogenase
VNIWGFPATSATSARSDLALMRRLKSALDPQNILAAGRF